MLNPGKYEAKLVDASLATDKEGNAQPMLSFEVQSEGNTEKMTWYGSLKSEKSTEFAVKALVTAGYMGNDWEDLKKPFEVMFTPKDLSITVDLGNNGKPQIKWINAKTVKAFTGVAPKQAALFAKAKADLGVKAKAPVTDSGVTPF